MAGRRSPAIARRSRPSRGTRRPSNNLGAALLKEGRAEQAIDEFRRALALQPDFAEAGGNLGEALNRLRRYEEAATAFRQALARQPNRAEPHLGLGRALQALDRPREAIKHFRLAVRLRPELAEAHAALGLALQQVGFVPKATESFETAVRLEPRQPAHYLNLVSLIRLGTGDARLAAMLALAEDVGSLQAAEQSALHFALGKALADAGDEVRGFEHVKRGNRFDAASSTTKRLAGSISCAGSSTSSRRS